MRVPKWWKYPAVFVFGVVYSLCMMWLGYSKHDCPETVVEVASDTIPPVVRGWVIEGEKVEQRIITAVKLEIPALAGMVAVETVSMPDGRYRYSDSLGDHYTDSSVIFRPRPRFGFDGLYGPFLTDMSDIYTDSLLAYSELCRRWESAETALKAQADSLAKKRGKICEDVPVKPGVN